VGFMTEGQIRDLIKKQGKKQEEQLDALLAEQQRTNQLLTAVLQALSGPQRAQQTTSWGQH
jgi:hypothetical protein